MALPLYSICTFFFQYYEGPDMDGLCEILKKLATDSQKHRAKKDRRQQRSSFREILRAVEVRYYVCYIIRTLKHLC